MILWRLTCAFTVDALVAAVKPADGVAFAAQEFLTRVLIVLFYLWTALGILLISSGFWVVTSELFAVRSAKRLFGLISAGGTLGAMTMGLSLNHGVSIVDTLRRLSLSSPIAGSSPVLTDLLAARPLSAGLAGLLVLSVGTVVTAESEWITTWRNKYPSSTLPERMSKQVPRTSARRPT